MRARPERKSPRRAIARAAALLAGALSLQCAAPKHPDLILIVIDTLRADHLGCYGYERPVSPAIDRLAAESIRFERAYTAAPWTLPAFASILTGLYPWNHGASLDFFAVRENVPLIAEQLRDAGYETAAFVSHIYTSSRYGFDRGYETFEEFGLPDNYAFDQEREPNAKRVVSAAIDWLDRRKRIRPFFLTVHLFDPHWDYAAPAPFAGTFASSSESFAVDGTFASMQPFMESGTTLPMRDISHLNDLYDEEIIYTDAWIDTLLTRLDAREPGAVVALTADHGEEFQEHGGLGHAHTFYDEVLRVPLLLRLPDAEGKGTVRAEWVGTYDIFPTLLAIAGVEAPASSGLSLLQKFESRDLFAATNRDGRYGRAILREPRKYVWDRAGSALLEPLLDPAEPRTAYTGSDVSLFESLAATATEGWSLRLPAEAAAVAGTVSVEGFILDVLPLTPVTPPVRTDGNTSFTFETMPTEASGFRFRVVPADAAVTFSLSSHGSAVPARRIRIGADGFPPPSSRFTLDPARAPERTFLPAVSQNDPTAIIIDLRPITNAPRTINLSPAERDRLRALGYF